MKKFLILVFMLFPAAVWAQTLEPLGNPNIVLGGSCQTSAPSTGSRCAVMLSANVAMFRVAPNLYLGGIGAALPTALTDVTSHLGSIVMATVPGITWIPQGSAPGTFWSKVLVQAGYSYVLTGDVQSRSGVFLGVGYAWNSPAYLGYRRAVKAQKAMLAKYPELAQHRAAYPLPPNPYEVK